MPSEALLELQRLRQTQGQQGSEAQQELARLRQAQVQTPTVSEFGGPLEEAEGLGETALQIGTGMLAEPIAGLFGIDAALTPGGETGPQAIERVREELTFQPKTAIGQRTSQAIAAPFQVLDDAVTRFAEIAGAGNPIAQTAVKTAILTLPMLFGIKTGVPNKIKINRAIKKVEKEANAMGIDLGSHDIRLQIAEAGKDRTFDVKSAGVQELQAGLIEKFTIAKNRNDALFTEARGTNASVRAASFEELNLTTRLALSSRDLKRMSFVTDRLSEIESMANLPVGTRIKLNAISKFRERLNNTRPPKTDLSQNAALNIIKSKLDEFLDGQFNQDMILGDPEALQAWKSARASNTKFRANFRDIKTIRQLVERETTPEQVKSWIIGASSVNAKKEAALVVRKLKEILGEDSPEITALRQEYLFDVIEPLMSEPPNFNRFLANYDKSIKNNPSLIKELAPFSKTAADKLAKISRATEKLGVKGQLSIPDVDLSRLGAVFMFGHKLARAAMRVSIARSTFDFLRGAGGQRKKLLQELSGYNPNTPIVPRRTVAYSAIISQEVSDRFGVKEPATKVRPDAQIFDVLIP